MSPERPPVTDAQSLAAALPVDEEAAARVARRYPLRIPAHFLSLIRKPQDPLWRQAVPSLEELSAWDAPDPLGEEAQSPTPGLVHRYPDRALFLVESRCALYCRHCMRKRRTGEARAVSPGALAAGLDYIRRTPALREVVLSGGDPLMMNEEALVSLLARLKAIRHVEVLRIHTRVPGADPDRVTERLASELARFAPLFVNIQFNHPAELTEKARLACRRLLSAGIPLGSQSVLLSGVNDDAQILARLFLGLLSMGVRPYALHHPDPVAGTRHFSVPLERGLALVSSLRGRISGMAVPHYLLDLPGGGGKTALLPGVAEKIGEGIYRIKSFRGEWHTYSDRRMPA